MKRFPLSALGVAAVWWALCTPVFGQPVPPRPADSGLDAELFFQLLLGELNVRGEEPSTGFALILDAARKTNNAGLYQRAVELAFQSRNGEAALQAARAWKQAFPQSREANRYVLQILVALNRLAVISGLARNYARAADKKQAATLVEQALAAYLRDATTGAAAWSTVGRMRLAAGDTAGALDAARRGHALNPRAEGPALLALELMDPKQPEAEALVRKHLDGQPLPEIRMGYARAAGCAAARGNARAAADHHAGAAGVPRGLAGARHAAGAGQPAARGRSRLEEVPGTGAGRCD
jgi:tetratricopeptide (TPR) repeat protein